MILTAQAIRNARMDCELNIVPWNEARLNPNSYNLSLANELLIYTEVELDCKRNNRYERFLIQKEGYLLQPGELYLARTEEYTETYRYVPMLEGRSSVGRLGISVHTTAGFGDIGYCGHWTLELSCIRPIRIYSGMQICQICYHMPIGSITQTYEGKYQCAKEVQPSSLWKDFQSGRKSKLETDKA